MSGEFIDANEIKGNWAPKVTRVREKRLLRNTVVGLCIGWLPDAPVGKTG